jgi:flagellar biosynthesis/type III secretory pathway protein FliH
MNWRSGSRVAALQAQGPEFKPQCHCKRKRKRERNEGRREGEREERRKEGGREEGGRDGRKEGSRERENLCALLVGMENDMSAAEKSSVHPQKN